MASRLQQRPRHAHPEQAGECPPRVREPQQRRRVPGAHVLVDAVQPRQGEPRDPQSGGQRKGLRGEERAVTILTVP